MSLATPTKSKVIVTVYRSPSQNHDKVDEFLSLESYNVNHFIKQVLVISDAQLQINKCLNVCERLEMIVKN